MQIRIPKNEEGKPDENGKLPPPKTKPTWKYVKQGRYCMGVASVKTLRGVIEGRRANFFDYSEKNILSISQYEEKIEKEIERVKKLTNQKKGSPWITSTRPQDDTIWD